MVGEVRDRVGDHDVARLLVDDLASDAELPRLHEVIIGRVLQSLARRGDGLVEERETFAAV